MRQIPLFTSCRTACTTKSVNRFTIGFLNSPRKPSPLKSIFGANPLSPTRAFTWRPVKQGYRTSDLPQPAGIQCSISMEGNATFQRVSWTSIYAGPLIARKLLLAIPGKGSKRISAFNQWAPAPLPFSAGFPRSHGSVSLVQHFRPTREIQAR